MAGPIYFAIGDVHGELSKLKALHEIILDRIAVDNRAARIVHLGDYVDRGPDSCGVIQAIIDLQKRFDSDPAVEVIALMGNHEEMMLSEVGHASLHWLSQGGRETLASYGIDARAHAEDWADLMPREHLLWLLKLPTLFYDETRRLAFAHAGIDPKAFPNCRDEVRLWTRSEGFTERHRWPDRAELAGLTVVHGHTPTDGFEPDAFAHRINVDTGAVYGGPLTAVMLKDDDAPSFLQVR
jgi:serine/threonine protein phosphatase 1